MHLTSDKLPLFPFYQFERIAKLRVQINKMQAVANAVQKALGPEPSVVEVCMNWMAF